MNISTDQLHEIFCVFFEHVMHASPEKMREMRASLSASPSRAGTTQVINDMLSVAKWWSTDTRNAVESAFKAKKLPSLRKLEATLRKKHRRILARGHIKDDDEFYIVAEILSDMDFDISDPERSALEGMSGEYEAKKK